MKTLVVYYSLEGNTKLMAESIATAVDADTLEIKPKKEIPSKGFMKYLWGGKAVMMKEAPELVPFEKSPQEYDMLFIGTPVWACGYAAPVNTFFKKNNIQGKKIALFCCHQGAKGKIFDKMKAALPGNEIVGQMDFREPMKVKIEESIKQVKEWAKETISG